MSPQNIRMSSTASLAEQNWKPAELTSSDSKVTTGFNLEKTTIVVSQRRQASDVSNAKITVSIEPASVSKREAIRRLNDEIEGRSSPTDTFASRTAG